MPSTTTFTEGAAPTPTPMTISSTLCSSRLDHELYVSEVKEEVSEKQEEEVGPSEENVFQWEMVLVDLDLERV